MTLVTLSVRDFAVPVPRVGSIETHSGFRVPTADGLLLHQQIQAERAKEEPHYRAEVPLEGDFERDGYRFRIGGRVDGFVEASEGRQARIEEIKTAFQIRDLERRLVRAPGEHPYCLQLRTYGYLYRRLHGVTPKLILQLVSTRSTSVREDLEMALDLEGYELWLERRLAELVEEAQASERRTQRRRELAQTLAFPFENPRPGQLDLVQTIEDAAVAKKRLLLQAPTGLGKTVGVLYPSLKEALARGQRVIYVTPKNSQHAVAEEAGERFEEAGASVKSLTLTAKSKICFKNEPLCDPGYCEYARDHYTKVAESGVLAQMASTRKLTFHKFRELGEIHQVCPYELQLEAARFADVVIGDYNYVFGPRSALNRSEGVTIGEEGKPNLVIDEAHNLPSRSMDSFSPSLSTFILENMRTAIRDLPPRFRSECEALLDGCIEVVKSCRPETGPPNARIDPPREPFLEQDAELRTFLARYLEADLDIQPKDPVLRLSFAWSAFTEALDFVSHPPRPEFFASFREHRDGGGTVKITCCDASEFLRDIYDKYAQVVGFSATLKPFAYYAKLCGLDEERLSTAEFASPFPKNHRKLLVVPQISTKFAQREKNYPKIAETIARIASLRKGNYFAFFPSFEFLERVFALFKPPSGFVALKQEREGSARAVEAMMLHLRARAAPTVVFAVQGGVYSEGVDYPGDMLVGAFVVGPPLPTFDLEREQMRAYYDKRYAGAGFDYAYGFPAMAKAVQAAGRVIRSETDRGLIVLLDERFLAPGYARSFPADWFLREPHELVSSKILSDVEEFWKQNE